MELTGTVNGGKPMNEKFFALPKEKQQAIMNAGYRVFSQNTYKKSPVSEIAAEAGISKSLLFHYFRNKLELYQFLWDQSGRLTLQYLQATGCYEQTDLFEAMLRGLRAKVRIMQRYPNLGAFVLRAYYENDEAVKKLIHESSKKYIQPSATRFLSRLDPSAFVPGLDLRMMYREMYWACEGYLWEKVQTGGLNAGTMEEDFMEMIDFWKKIYLKREG